MINNARTSSYQSLSNSELITDPARVVPLLERLAQHYTPLAVHVPGSREPFTSCIVAVNRQHVLLDELMPSTGHALLLAERRLRVTGKLDGIDIQFTTTLEHVDEQEKALTYHMKLPERLEYRQRRSAYRVHIPMTKKLRIVIENNDATVFEGELYDLSRGGAGMLFPADEPNVKPGLLHECAIELPDDTWLYCAVELRYSKQMSTRKRQHIGARFVDLGPVQTQLIVRCIAELERELIRKRAAR